MASLASNEISPASRLGDRARPSPASSTCLASNAIASVIKRGIYHMVISTPSTTWMLYLVSKCLEKDSHARPAV